jgi:hypothetical protein
LGLLGNNGPITIIVGKQFHTNDNELIKISENDIIKVEVIAKKFSLNDKEIKIIGKLWNENDTDKKDLTSSDITPIIQENDYIELDNQEFIYDNEENDTTSINNEDELEEDNLTEDEDDEERDEDEDEDEEEVKLENPENNIDANDIELDDEEYEEDTESLNEYE